MGLKQHNKKIFMMLSRARRSKIVDAEVKSHNLHSIPALREILNFDDVNLSRREVIVEIV